MPASSYIYQGMASNASKTTSTGQKTTTTTPTSSEDVPTLSERELMKIEFYKTYDVMTGVRIAATLSGFFSIMVLLVIYKSRCKSNRQLDDPRLKAAAAAAVAEAEAEERALAVALEAIARLPPKPSRGPRRSLCADKALEQISRFSSVAGDYDSLLSVLPSRRSSKQSSSGPHRRCSSITCSSTASSYLERRGSAMVMPCLPTPPAYPKRYAQKYQNPHWDLYHHHHPIDIQVIQPTPEMSPCASEAGLYGAVTSRHSSSSSSSTASSNNHKNFNSMRGVTEEEIIDTRASLTLQKQLKKKKRAPLASMVSVDPPETDSHSFYSDSVFNDITLQSSLRTKRVNSNKRSSNEDNEDDDEEEDDEDDNNKNDNDCPPDTEDEVSGFSTDSSDRGATNSSAAGLKNFLKLLPTKKRDGNSFQRQLSFLHTQTSPPPVFCQSSCTTISASVEAFGRSPVLSATTTLISSPNMGEDNTEDKSVLLNTRPIQSKTEITTTSSPLELKHQSVVLLSGPATSNSSDSRLQRSSSSPPIVWSQETLF